MTRQVSDSDRDTLKAAILAALRLIARGGGQLAAGTMGLSTAPALSDGAVASLDAYADERAGMAQRGINAQLATLDDAAPDAVDALLIRLRREMEQHNDETLFPQLANRAYHEGVIDAYRQTPDPARPGHSKAEAQDWSWEQETDNPDSCADAADASPAPLQELLDIAGGPPGLHIGCMCSLDPA